MTTLRYTYKHEVAPTKVDLPCDKNASHGDHWAILTNDIAEDVPAWLQKMIDTATLPTGLAANRMDSNKILLAGNDSCHIKQILAMQDGKPQAFINAFPAVNSPYGTTCQIERVIRCDATSDAILRFKTKDGAVIYAFDQLYAVNRGEYRTPKDYFVNFSAWAYHIAPSNQDESILVEDPDAIRYHRAFNDIVSANGGNVPDDIDERIRAWQPTDNTELAPVEINLGHSCIYLFGETFGQEDEAWCQGQVLGISHTEFYGKDITLFDTVILREPDADPLVVRIAAVSNDDTAKIQVHDYIQANIWLQAAIYAENQKAVKA
ncbi:hypothetical protein B0181_00055 [Moraxella caviae]|uniref:Uncharacterized protein n=1 Tax=Moraxella caviae TaxID=34060 RepID=A0A1T0ADS9_9GAMM|nr:hypothetical protein [Moraxella caviae]OOR93876.1 hypothetical protein B0181_00055 [Moraxella caviae]STZ14117.1 Uncharacterised protein [Moraxella caviae]